MPLRAPLAATITTAFLLVAPGAAGAANAGETFLAGGLALPAGALPSGPAGWSGHGPTRVSVSGDGRYVAFAAGADVLSDELGPDVTGIFRKDRATGALTLVSRADGPAGAPASESGEQPVISDDGRRVAWRTTAALDPADTDGGGFDVYVRDLGAGTTTLASQGTGGLQTTHTGGFDLAGDGAHVAFTTPDALAGADDANGVADVYLRDLDAGTTRLVSATPAGTAGNAPSSEPSLTRDAAYVAYASRATDLNAAFTDRNGPGDADVWLRAMGSRTQTLVSSRAFAATEGGGGESTAPHVANPAPGTVYVAYLSEATDVGQAGVDTSATRSVYRRALFQAFSTLVSRAGGGANADRTAFARDISADGTRIVFDSSATNLGRPPGLGGATYVHDAVADTTTHVSGEAQDAEQGGISADGTTVAWASSHGITADSELELPGVFARPLGGVPELVSRPPGGAPLRAPALPVEGRDAAPSFSADGRYVVFSSPSRHLPGAAGGIGDGIAQVYRRDLLTGAIELVSRADGPAGASATASVYEATISADGTRVAFTTEASLSPADGDQRASVYVRDLAAQTTTLVSRADGPDGANADDDASGARLSADGRHVVFATPAGNLGVPQSTTHVYVRDLAAATTRLVDRADGAGGAVGDDYADEPSISGDGRLVAFVSRARNLAPDAADGDVDVYVRDVVAGTTRLVSRRPDGAPAVLGAHEPVVSADGRTVAFSARDEQLAPEGGPWNGTRQIVARDLAAGVNRLVSRAPGDGPAGDAGSSSPSISADGTRVGFQSWATNLLPGRGGASRAAVYARDLTSGTLAGPPAFGRLGNAPENGAWLPGVSPDGRCLGLVAQGHNAATGPAGDLVTLYVHALSDGCATAASGGGGGGGGGGAGEAPRAPALRAPRVTGASLSARRFRVARRATAKVAGAVRASAAAKRRPRARRPRRAPAGTTVRFRLSAAADVTIAFERKAKGRKAGRACRRPSRRLRRKPRCARWVAAGALTRRQLAAGRRTVAFSGRIGRRALAPGAYRATIAARNAAGRAAPVRLAFRVVRG